MTAWIKFLVNKIASSHLMVVRYFICQCICMDFNIFRLNKATICHKVLDHLFLTRRSTETNNQIKKIKKRLTPTWFVISCHLFGSGEPKQTKKKASIA